MTVIHVPYGNRGVLDLDVREQHLVLDTDVPFPAEIGNLSEAIWGALDNPVAGPPFSERLERRAGCASWWITGPA